MSAPVELRLFQRHRIWFCTDDDVQTTASTAEEALRLFMEVHQIRMRARAELAMAAARLAN